MFFGIIPTRKKKKTKDEYFESVYESYKERVIYYVNTHLKLSDACEKDSCVNDVFMKIWDKLAQYKAHPNKSGFVIAITKKTVQEYIREFSNSSEKKINLTYIEDTDDIPGGESAEDYVIGKIIYRDLNTVDISEVINKLSASQRELYIMKYVDKRTNAEIAERLGATERGVKWSYTKLREEIRQIVKNL